MSHLLEQPPTPLDENVQVKSFMKKKGVLQDHIASMSQEKQDVLKAFIASQGILETGNLKKDEIKKRLERLVDVLIEIETFYSEIGGIFGYYQKMKELLHEDKKEFKGKVYKPEFIDISFEDRKVHQMIFAGLKNLPKMCEMYPMGGAADRLHLCDAVTKKPLPGAMLRFNGKSLIEGLLQDLEAKEYLYYKIFRQKLFVPICLMTSDEKDNHEHIVRLFQENKWFDRPKDSVSFFKQPSVLTMTPQGSWCFIEALLPLLKPGGHGALWKLAHDQGVFDWLKKQKKTKALLRQINNPISGIDYGLLAFTGYGSEKDMYFGFASCPRDPKAAEGINVLIEQKQKDGYAYSLSNVEYCNVSLYGMNQKEYLQFTSNTNILFADLHQVEAASIKSPLPGALINQKEIEVNGKKIKMVRLETTMQNINDSMPEHADQKTKRLNHSYITFNRRLKTISTAKKVYHEKGFLETPEKCFYDLLLNRKELLEICGIKAPHLPSFKKYMKEGPSFIFNYHPALGPLYGVICQKLKEGVMKEGSVLDLQIAEAFLENLRLEGALIVEAEQVTGHLEKEVRSYSERVGRLYLKNVRVENAGLERSCSNIYWKKQYRFKEKLKIELLGESEFYAENVCFQGNESFKVMPGTRLVVYQEKGILYQEIEKLEKPTWNWQYSFDKNLHIKLKQRQKKERQKLCRSKIR